MSGVDDGEQNVKPPQCVPPLIDTRVGGPSGCGLFALVTRPHFGRTNEWQTAAHGNATPGLTSSAEGDATVCHNAMLRASNFLWVKSHFQPLLRAMLSRCGRINLVTWSFAQVRISRFWNENRKSIDGFDCWFEEILILKERCYKISSHQQSQTPLESKIKLYIHRNMNFSYYMAYS